MNTKLFVVLELFVIFVSCYAMGVETNVTISLMLLLFISKVKFGKPMHYKKWYICAVWSYCIFMGLMFIFKADIFICILSTVFTAYVTSGKGNIEDMFMFKNGKPSKYIKLDEFIQYNFNDHRLLAYETYLKQNDTLMYNIYYLRFRQKCSFDEIKTRTNIQDQKRIVQILDNIYETLKYNLLLE